MVISLNCYGNYIGVVVNPGFVPDIAAGRRVRLAAAGTRLVPSVGEAGSPGQGAS